jgi:hypothetical protein
MEDGLRRRKYFISFPTPPCLLSLMVPHYRSSGRPGLTTQASSANSELPPPHLTATASALPDRGESSFLVRGGFDYRKNGLFRIRRDFSRLRHPTRYETVSAILSHTTCSWIPVTSPEGEALRFQRVSANADHLRPKLTSSVVYDH